MHRRRPVPGFADCKSGAANGGKFAPLDLRHLNRLQIAEKVVQGCTHAQNLYRASTNLGGFGLGRDGARL